MNLSTEATTTEEIITFAKAARRGLAAKLAFHRSPLLGPLVFWIAWNVLDFGHALGLPELTAAYP